MNFTSTKSNASWLFAFTLIGASILQAVQALPAVPTSLTIANAFKPESDKPAPISLSPSARPGPVQADVGPTRTQASPSMATETPQYKTLAEVEEDYTADGKFLHDYRERWVDFCNGCKPSTGVTSFL